MKQETTLLRPSTTATIMEAAAIAVELDDDLFFADLSKQISLLIMDDDDDQELTHSSSVSLQGYSQTIQYPSAYQQTLPFVYNQQSCTRESKGTGVFIPTSLISQPRRKSRSKNNNNNNIYNTSSNSKLHKNQQEEMMSSRGLLQKTSYNDSFNPRKSNY